MWRFERMRARRSAVQVRKSVGDFGVDLAKAFSDDVDTIARGSHFLGSPRALELEKADAKIGFVGGNLGIGAPRQRS
ncbi:hypothetical protein [Bradyrhizobium sp. WD16]|uniref:hypothetical protein n=1 Tax=Bradyrhizobium sp. WD16 TaxID=1521768 RepID=UPI0020A2F072|nr:hypothetical protein [Bradyrhizobium sp. WD16]UTD29183.1 hypothetical protein DB459_22010 [Bradyrhizobium sp. WD16]